MQTHQSLMKGGWIAVCLILAGQAAVSTRLSVSEIDSPRPELHRLPLELGRWTAEREDQLDPKVTEYLHPDEYVLRDYAAGAGESPISLFMAYFRSLQNSYGPHSPRVCLPGAGWLVRSSSQVTLPVDGQRQGIPVNKYVLEKSGERILVLYWYQNDRDVWADEFHAKLRLLPDLIELRRSDASLVRLVSPIRGTSPESEYRNCAEFVRLIFPPIAESLAAAVQKIRR